MGLNETVSKILFHSLYLFVFHHVLHRIMLNKLQSSRFLTHSWMDSICCSSYLSSVSTAADSFQHIGHCAAQELRRKFVVARPGVSLFSAMRRLFDICVYGWFGRYPFALTNTKAVFRSNVICWWLRAKNRRSKPPALSIAVGRRKEIGALNCTLLLGALWPCRVAP